MSHFTPFINENTGVIWHKPFIQLQTVNKVADSQHSCRKSRQLQSEMRRTVSDCQVKCRQLQTIASMSVLTEMSSSKKWCLDHRLTFRQRPHIDNKKINNLND